MIDQVAAALIDLWNQLGLPEDNLASSPELGRRSIRFLEE
jgi:hypothetical protein